MATEAVSGDGATGQAPLFPRTAGPCCEVLQRFTLLVTATLAPGPRQLGAPLSVCSTAPSPRLPPVGILAQSLLSVPSLFCLSGSPRFLVHQGEAFVKIALMGLAGLIYRNCTSKQFWRNDFRIRTPHQLCGFQMFFPHSLGCLKRCFHSFWGKRPAVGLLDRTVVLFLIS